MLLIHLNVFPLSATQTVAVFSYLRTSGRLARRSLRSVLRKQGEERLNNLWRLVLDVCGNLMFAPLFVSAWSQVKREAILDYFVRTAQKSEPDARSPYFDIFTRPN